MKLKLDSFRIYDYLGINISKADDGQHEFTQPSLIDAIINDVGIGPKQRKSVPMSTYKLLHHHMGSLPHNPCHTIITTLTTDRL